MTRLQDVALSQRDWRVLVETLAGVAWIGDNSGSDAWGLEVFESVDEMTPEQLYVRQSKFSVTYTSASKEPTRAHRHIHPYQIHSNRHGRILVFLDDLIGKWFDDDSDAVALVQTFHYIFSARFESPVYSNPWRDIALIWSAFESFYKVPNVPQLDGERVGKDDFIFDTVKAELNLNDMDWLIDAVGKWLKKAYLVRNAYVHGGRYGDFDLVMVEYDSTIYGVGIRLLKILLLSRIHTGSDVRLFLDPSGANSLCSWLGKPYIEGVYDALLKEVDEKKQQAFADPDVQKAFDTVVLWSRLPELHNKNAPDTANRPPSGVVRNSVKTLALMLSKYTQNVPDESVKTDHISDDLKKTFQGVQQWIPEGEWAVACRLAAKLDQSDAGSRRPYNRLLNDEGVELPDSVPIAVDGVSISPWDLADVLIKIVKASLGWKSDVGRGGGVLTMAQVDEYLSTLAN